MKNGNKVQKKSETVTDGLVMMLGGHCFQGPMCISKYGNVMHSGSRVDVQKRKYRSFLIKSEEKEDNDDYVCQGPTNRLLGG